MCVCEPGYRGDGYRCTSKILMKTFTLLCNFSVEMCWKSNNILHSRTRLIIIIVVVVEPGAGFIKGLLEDLNLKLRLLSWT